MARPDRPRGDDPYAQLEELEEIYRAAPVGLCLVDPDLRFLRINERMASINGHAVEDHIGRSVEELLPEFAEQILPRYRKVLLTGEAIDNVEMTDARGERVWRVSDRPVKTAAGDVSGIITVVQEITDLKRTERELRATRERLHRAEQVAHLGCWEWNLRTGEVWWSQEEYRIFGRDPRHFTPSFDAFIEHVTPEHRSLVREQLDAIFAGLEANDVEYRIDAADGEERMLRSIATLRRDVTTTLSSLRAAAERG